MNLYFCSGKITHSPDLETKAKNISLCKDIYRIEEWGEGFFKINDQGHLCAHDKENNIEIDIKKVIETMQKRGLEAPVVIRFQDILKTRIKDLNIAFKNAIEKKEYKGSYFGVYPIKVNQMREVVEEVVQAGKPFKYGLEAGSKAELLAVLAYQVCEDSLIILNGYKDDEFVRLALLGTRLGHNIHIVIESILELHKILKISEELNLSFQLGLRIKVSSSGYGQWAKSSGEKSKFGLSSVDLMSAITLLKEHNKLGSVTLLHFHLGSQVSDIATFREGLIEGVRVYSELLQLGASVKFIDVGGGLAVDYDGSSSNNYSSKNYNLEEYALNTVQSIQDLCKEVGVEEPHIVTESGRFVTAHHSCIITPVVDVICSNNKLIKNIEQSGDKSLLQEQLERVLKNLTDKNCAEQWHELKQLKIEMINSFKYGLTDLRMRAQLDQDYQIAIQRVYEAMKNSKSIDYTSEIEEIENKNQQQYLCNFSVFQSVADSWAIDQILPILPIHRLNEYPKVSCTLADITCDSDGKIDNFLDQNGSHTKHLPVHNIIKNEPYYLGIFLTGAYQDVMGDMHNLFGRLNEIHVYSDSDSKNNFFIEEFIPGSSKENVLSTMQYSRDVMLEKITIKLEHQIALGKIRKRESKVILNLYAQSLSDYTYLYD